MPSTNTDKTNSVVFVPDPYFGHVKMLSIDIHGYILHGGAYTAPVLCDGSRGPQPVGGTTTVHVDGKGSPGLQLEGGDTTAPVRRDGGPGLQQDGGAAIAPVNVDGGRDSLQHGAGGWLQRLSQKKTSCCSPRGDDRGEEGSHANTVLYNVFAATCY